MSDAVSQTECANCGAELHGAYCAACGQRVTALNPTFRGFLHDFTHELLHVDSKIFQSVRLLLTKPGFLSREWFEGRRARYVSPIRLYLVFSVAFFAVAAAGSALTIKVTSYDQAEFDRAPAGLQNIVKNPDLIRARVTTWVPRAMVVLVPLFALLVSGVTRSAGRNYPQDLYFAFHVHAALFAVMAAGAIVRRAHTDWIDALVALGQFAFVSWYLTVALRVAYGGTRRRAIGRAAVVGVSYFFAVAATVVAVALAAAMIGSS